MDPLQADLAQLRQELVELRAEQREMKVAIEELVRTFRAIAVHLGIAAEPYRKTTPGPEKSRDFSGFA